MSKIRTDLIGKEFETNNCGQCIVIDYKNYKSVYVKFYKPYQIVECRLDHLMKGAVKNPLTPSFYGVGYIGAGGYGFKDKSPYKVWLNMLKRAYNIDFRAKFLTYKNVTVCEEWLNFQNFAGWYYCQPLSNAKDLTGKSYHLDKDILVKGSKIYSPETCCFVPHEINSLLTHIKFKNNGFPVGVWFHKKAKKFTTKLNFDNQVKHLGYFDTPEQAFSAYKEAKEAYIKDVANKWKGKIDDKVYEALLKYEITPSCAYATMV